GNVDGDIEQQERQRFAVSIEAQARIDATFQYVIEHEIEGVELGKIVAYDTRWLSRGEYLGHTLHRDLGSDGFVVRWIATDERDVEPITLVARSCAGDLMQAHGLHVPLPSIVTRGLAYLRSIRQDALARRGVVRRRTPAPPAGPAQ